MANISPHLAFVITQFLNWFEDHFAEECWLDPNDGPDGTWKSYLEIPEYKAVQNALRTNPSNSKRQK